MGSAMSDRLSAVFVSGEMNTRTLRGTGAPTHCIEQSGNTGLAGLIGTSWSSAWTALI